jgi:hypothetical protein
MVSMALTGAAGELFVFVRKCTVSVHRESIIEVFKANRRRPV